MKPTPARDHLIRVFKRAHSSQRVAEELTDSILAKHRDEVLREVAEEFQKCTCYECEDVANWLAKGAPK